MELAQWVQRARRLGVAARPVRQRAVYAPGASSGTDCRVDANAIFVDVVGDRAFLVGGRAARADEASLAQAAIALARDAGVELLRVYFEPGSEQTPVFLEAGLWIDIAAESVAERFDLTAAAASCMHRANRARCGWLPARW